MDLKEKVAIVTGGGSGIGFYSATELLKKDLKGVTLVDINEKRGKIALKELQEKYGKNKVIFVRADVSDMDQFENAFKKTIETFKNVDILINNAGIMNDRMWQKEINTNVVGSINGSLLAIEKYIVKHKSGSEGVIVNISSVGGLDVSWFIPVYCATKHAITAFSRCLGTELYYGISNVRVFCVCPGPTKTELVENWKDKTLGTEYTKALEQIPVNIVYQDPAHVGQTVTELIKDAPNGSVWVVEDSKSPFKVEFPDLTKLSQY